MKTHISVFSIVLCFALLVVGLQEEDDQCKKFADCLTEIDELEKCEDLETPTTISVHAACINLGGIYFTYNDLQENPRSRCCTNMKLEDFEEKYLCKYSQVKREISLQISDLSLCC